jgi:uncharacterized protein (TIGR02453 family)
VAFEGIPLAALDFYEDLEADNSKSFWQAHKNVYDESVKAPLEALAAELEPTFGAPKVFRPYRDIRFSKDKTPYKTHQGIWFGESSMYLHVAASGLFIAGGYWDTTSAQVDRMRRAIADDVPGNALAQAVAAVKRKGYEIGGHQLTRVPAGYDKDHPRHELLRYKTLTAHREFGCPDWLPTPKTKREITKAWKSISPLVSWLDTHVGRG